MIDGSWTSTAQFSGYGWVWLDCLGNVQLMGTRNHIRRESALQLEMKALRWAMESMLQHSTCQSFGTDCKDLIVMINEPHVWPSFATELERIETPKICIPDFKITYIPRAQNQISDFLARTARHVTNPHGIRVPSSVFLLSGGLHNESTQKVETDSDEELADADEEEASDSLSKLNVNESGAGGEDDANMHKHHDPEGLLTYLGLKVKRDFMCLYCSELCHAFSSLEAVRKHMEAKSHCKLHYGDKKEARNRIQLSLSKYVSNRIEVILMSLIHEAAQSKPSISACKAERLLLHARDPKYSEPI
ncbi:hypothetical protein F2Q69_00059510 [Brassica cretica]|uniref:C2H2-type domain-containing protein n=1 Tax=Brassica cretica TaxID=69181 RepID=A0A8S9RBI4_BRACR|nr:hypothetical protein F2Q69_00059510 [Brassica cretica]